MPDSSPTMTTDKDALHAIKDVGDDYANGRKPDKGKAVRYKMAMTYWKAKGSLDWVDKA